MQFISDIQKVVSTYGLTFFNGAKLTLILAIIGTIIGCLIGFGVGVVQTIPKEKHDSLVKRGLITTVQLVLRGYIELFRGTPMICQAVFLYFGTMTVFDVNMDMMTAGILVVSINTGAYMAETVRGGIMSIDPGQTEGAKAIGMSHVQTMLTVILPQTLRNIIPQIGNYFIINIKDTSVLSIIGVADLFYAHKTASGALYLYFPSATVAMAIYLVMTLISARLLRLWENALADKDSYELVDDDDAPTTLHGEQVQV